MNIRIGKSALLVILLALLSIGAYWYWSPFIAIKSMQAAARASDADAFNTHVDYPRLRESLKSQFSAIMAEKMGQSSDSKNPFEAIGSMLGLAMVDKLVDAMVRPETVMRGMKSGQFGPKPSRPQTSESDSAGGDVEKVRKWIYERKGTDLLIAYPEGPGPNQEKIGFVFERSGFAHWKVTELRLPIPAT
jgi:hypothetical protein